MERLGSVRVRHCVTDAQTFLNPSWMAEIASATSLRLPRRSVGPVRGRCGILCWQWGRVARLVARDACMYLAKVLLAYSAGTARWSGNVTLRSMELPDAWML